MGKQISPLFPPPGKILEKSPCAPPLEKILPTPMTRAQFMSSKCSYYNTGQGSATNLTSILQNHPNQLSAFILVSLLKIIVSLTVSIIMSTVTNQNVNYLRVLSRISVFIVTASFALWQQATIEFTRRDHSVIAFSRHAYMVLFFRAHSVRGEPRIQGNASGEVATLSITCSRFAASFRGINRYLY